MIALIPESVMPILQWVGMTSVLSAAVLGFMDGVRPTKEGE